MGSTRDHLVNGIVSMVVSVAFTVLLADDDPGPYDLRDVALSVAVSSFLSGYFTGGSRRMPRGLTPWRKPTLYSTSHVRCQD